MAVQDTYTATPAKGFPGMVSNMETSNRISRTCEDAAGIPFGAAAFRGSGDHGCTDTVGTAATFLGPVIAEPGIPVLPGGVAADLFPLYESVPIMTQGAILVTAQDAVTDGAPVYVDAATGGWTDTSTDNIATDWIFDETVAAAALVRIVRR